MKNLLPPKHTQLFLKSVSKYHGNPDGKWGMLSDAAARNFLRGQRYGYSDLWNVERCKVAVDQHVIKTRGIDVGVVDGFVGPQTAAALELYQNLVVELGAAGNLPAIATGKTKWPKQTQLELRRFFGEPGKSQARCEVPFEMELAWDPKTKLTGFSCHELVKEPFERVFAAALSHYGIEQLQKMGITKFGGCLNVRKMRGGSSMSLHSWGIAVDLDPARNQFRWTSDQANFAKPEFDVFWSIVESEGMVSLGKERNFDWMHFQAAAL